MENKVSLPNRSCDGCHKCCDGWLFGSALGKDFYPGKPCHFVQTNKGCQVYKDRPQDPCKAYHCEWLTNNDLPEWFKPDQSNLIITKRTINGYDYWDVIEAGDRIDSIHLNWLLLHVYANQQNVVYRVDGGINFLGVTGFIEAYKNA
jgi:uncharacterized cysteine cluster protein YcgN (CxxCxxCC family)